MASDYGTMQTRIAAELVRTDLTTLIQESIQSAIANYANQKFWFNEQQATAATTSGISAIGVPSDFLQLDKMELIYNNFPRTLVQRTWATILSFTIDTTALVGIPTDIAYYADQFWFYPMPNAAYSLRMWYLKSLSLLANSSDSNAWTTSAEELIRSRAKADIEANYLHKAEAIADQQRLAVDRQGFLCSRELVAYNSLTGLNTQRMTSGSIQPSTF